MVRLITSAGFLTLPLADAQDAADKATQDLVLIQEGSDTELPICKVMDYDKIRFEEQKRKKKPGNKELKEIQFRPTTQTSDFLVKLGHIKRFLKEKHRVKVTIKFTGREKKYINEHAVTFRAIDADVSDLGVPENNVATISGGRVSIVYRPKRTNEKTKSN